MMSFIGFEVYGLLVAKALGLIAILHTVQLQTDKFPHSRRSLLRLSQTQSWKPEELNEARKIA